MCLLCFYNTLVSKTAAMNKIVYSRYIYREFNVLVLPNRSHINFSSLNFKLVFLGVLFHSDRKKTFAKKSKTKRCKTHFSHLILYH